MAAYRNLAPLLASFAFLQAPAALAATSLPTSAQQDILGKHGLAHAKTIVYRNALRQAIAADVFFAQVGGGAAFTINKEGQDSDMMAVLTLQPDEATAPAALKRGHQLPDMKLTRLDGKTIDNQALAGKFTLLSFFFSTCPPCIKEVPELNALAQAHRDVNMVAVTFDAPDEARHFASKTGLRLSIAANAQAFIDALGVKTYPTLLLVDPKGKIVDIARGSAPGKEDLAKWLRKHLADAQG